MNILKKILIAFTIAFYSICLYGQQGVLDIEFNSNGKVITDLKNASNDNGTKVLVQNDNKIIVVGISDFDAIGIVRYNVNGNLDPTFGIDGIVLTHYGYDKILGISAVLQNDEKIIVGGYVSGNTYADFAVVRYNTDGSLDTSFGVDGIVTTNFGSTDYGYAITLQPDGKIILAGYANIVELEGAYCALARYNTDGTLDDTFGSGGKVSTGIQYSENHLTSIAINSDGKIVVAGETILYPDVEYNFAVLQYNPNGTLDTTFNNTGIIITDINNNSKDFAQTIAIQTDGKIIVGGSSESNSDSDFALVRYNTDGSLDTTFNYTGIVTTDLNSYGDWGSSVIVHTNGKIFFAGYAQSTTDNDYVIICYNTDGSIDNTFGDNGITWTDFGVGDDKAKSICIANDGKIIASGYSSDGNGYFDYSVARYLYDLTYGIVDFEGNNCTMLVYPNPIQNNAIVKYELKTNETISLFLYDCSGNQIKSFITNEIRKTGKHQEIISFENTTPEGNYILVLSNGKYHTSINIIKK